MYNMLDILPSWPTNNLGVSTRRNGRGVGKRKAGRASSLVQDLIQQGIELDRSNLAFAFEVVTEHRADRISVCVWSTMFTITCRVRATRWRVDAFAVYMSVECELRRMRAWANRTAGWPRRAAASRQPQGHWRKCS